MTNEEALLKIGAMTSNPEMFSNGYYHALKIACESISRQIPKKPVYSAIKKKYNNIFDGSEVEMYEVEICPTCEFYPLEVNHTRLPSCPICNQRIDWGEEE